MLIWRQHSFVATPGVFMVHAVRSLSQQQTQEHARNSLACFVKRYLTQAEDELKHEMASAAVTSLPVLNPNEMLGRLLERIQLQYAGTSVTLGIFLKDLLRDLTATRSTAFVLLFAQGACGNNHTLVRLGAGPCRHCTLRLGSVNLTAYNMYPMSWTPLGKWFVNLLLCQHKRCFYWEKISTEKLYLL